MAPPEKLKRKLLAPDTDGDRDKQTGVILYALSTILQMAGALKASYQELCYIYCEYIMTNLDLVKNSISISQLSLCPMRTSSLKRLLQGSII